MKTFITVDVECYSGDFEREVWGGGLGLEYILKSLKQTGVKAAFFVEAIGVTRWGEKEVSRLCERILGDGHVVGLHVHPSTARINGFHDNADVLWMHERDVQCMLIREGLKILSRCGAGNVHVFRAGDFAADDNTIAAMKEAGLFIGSNRDLDAKCSTRSHLNEWFPAQNDVSCREGVTDIPLSVLKSPFSVLDGRFRHMEISAMSFGEMSWGIRKMRVLGYKAACVLTHPREFFSNRAGTIIPLEKNKWRWERLLEFVRHEPSIKIGVMDNVQAEDVQKEQLEIPVIPAWRTMFRIVEQATARLKST